MPSHFCSINKLAERDNDDPTIKTLLASFSVGQTEQTRNNILVARNQQQTKVLGVLIAEECQKQTVKITYIYVKPMWRRLSIGSALIQRLEKECQAKGITTITATFDRENQAMNALTQSHKGWSDGELIYRYTFSSKQAMRPVLDDLEKLNRRSLSRSTAVTVQPLVNCDRNALIHASTSNEIPEWGQLNNHKLVSSAKDFSRVVYQDNRVIGWLITYPLGRETLDYRTLWTDQTHRNTGASLSALIEVIRKAHFQDQKDCQNDANDLGFPWPQGFFLVNSENKAMTNFVNKRLDSATPDRSELIFKEKQLSRNADQGSETH